MPAASPSPDELLQPGLVLDGRYRIDGALGGGGMARVYRAEHLGIGRPVAIKVLHARLSQSRDAVARFRREAVTSGRLEHPNIVSVTDSGMLHDGRCFLVMEALEGETLGERLARDGRLPWRDALILARGVLIGLGHAHAHGVIHRDVKPDNVFLLRRPEEPLIKILDFGIAKLHAGAGEEARITQEGLTVGSPTYMSPEQAADGEITPASDLYSTTVVLFEMLTGRPPFDRRDPVSTMKAHIGAPPPRLRELAPELAPELPEALEELVERGLAKRAADRVAPAALYLQVLDEILAGGPPRDVRGPPRRAATSPPHRPPPLDDDRTMFVRVRPPSRAWLVLGSAALAAIVLAAGYLIAWPPAGEAGPAAPPVALAVAAPAPAPDAAPADADAGELSAEEPEEIDMTPEAELDRPPAGSTTRARPRDRDPARTWIRQGKTALRAGKFDEATASFRRALAANRNAHAALAGLAEIAYNRADFAGAARDASRAVAIAPAIPSYRMTLAKAYYKLLYYDDAIGQWRKVLELDPANRSAKRNIELARAKVGR